MISLTSRRPPASRFTLLGLLVTSSSALSCFPLTAPGLGGAVGFFLVGLPSTPDAVVVAFAAGISSHSAPAMLSSLMKNGQSLASILKDSLASAVEMGTGDDLMIAVATSEVGKARRLRLVGVAEEPVAGVEKSL